MITRRTALVGIGAALTAPLAIRALGETYIPPPFGPQITPVSDPKTINLELIAKERMISLPAFKGQAMPLWTFGDEFVPVVRMRLGDILATKLVNELPKKTEHTSVHWHGLRIPNDQDGVPYISQPPVNPGESWEYAFTPPDAGTYFFHTHCNTVEQLGRGLAGIIIVEGDEVEPFDAEEVLVLKDWRIDEKGTFMPFFTPEGASKRGSFGTIRSCNGATNPTIETPARGDVRLRIVNVDNTRVMMLGVEGAEAYVIAIDGIACPPFPLETWMLGPAMRFDVLIRTPDTGKTARLVDYFAPKPIPLATFHSIGPNLREPEFQVRALRAGRIAPPDLDNAKKKTFSFSAAAGKGQIATAPSEGFEAQLLGSLCLSFQPNWAINGTVWPSRDHSEVPPPIETLKLGQTYIFTLKNLSSVHHPIHIHGHTFTVLKSNKRRHLPPHFSDTILLAPKERISVAFVADNPGDWMFHCHLIEHQETGMMSYLRVK